TSDVTRLDRDAAGQGVADTVFGFNPEPRPVRPTDAGAAGRSLVTRCRGRRDGEDARRPPGDDPLGVDVGLGDLEMNDGAGSQRMDRRDESTRRTDGRVVDAHDLVSDTQSGLTRRR